MTVRSRDDIYRKQDLKGKKIGLSKSLSNIKNGWKNQKTAFAWEFESAETLLPFENILLCTIREYPASDTTI
jgi:hypothetical protein